MLESWGVVVEGFRVVSGQGNVEGGANLLNVRIWVEGVVLENEPHCVAKTQGKILTTYQHAGGGRPDSDT